MRNTFKIAKRKTAVPPHETKRGKACLLTEIEIDGWSIMDDTRMVCACYAGDVTEEEYDRLFSQQALNDVYNSLRDDLNRAFPNCELPKLS